MTLLEKLLVVQEHDTAIDQLEHRRAHLAVREQLDELLVAETELESRRAALDAELAVLGSEQRRLEDEIASTEAKRSATDGRLYGGAISAPRELQALQDEAASLLRRQDLLEDKLLEVLTSMEPLESSLEQLAAEGGELVARRARLEAELGEAAAEIDAEIAELREARELAAAQVEEGALAEYEVLRRRLGGIAVARLVGSSCGGCHLALSAVDLDRLRRLPADEVASCEECGRLLVR